MSFDPTIAWKASPTRTPPPICTSALGSQTALVWRAVGAASGIRDTSCPISRNGNDSTRALPKSTSRSQNQAAAFGRSSKVLNLRGDSKRRAVVTFLMIAQNKFINCLRLGEAGMRFRTTDRHYADKWLCNRVFFCSSRQGNPAGLSNDVAQSRLLFQKRVRATISANIIVLSSTSYKSGLLHRQNCTT